MSAWKSFKSGLSAFTATTRDTFGCTGNNGDAMDDEADNSYTADANGSDSGQPAFVEIDFLRRDVNRRRKFPDNSIRTAKYTLASGLPLSLLYQFYKISNFYFLLVMVLSLVPGASPINPFSSVVPLCIVLGAGIVKDLWEDWKRRKADQQANEMIVHVLRVVTDPDGSLPSAAAASSPYGSADDEATPSPCAAVSHTATTHHGGQGGNETTSSGTRACKPAAASASEAGDRKSNSATATAADGSVAAASFKEGQEVPVKERKRNRVVHFLFPSEKSKTRSSATVVSDMGSPDSNTHAAGSTSQHQQGDESAAASLLVLRPSKESDSAAKAPSASSTAAGGGHGAPRVTFQPIRSCDVYPGDIMLFRLGEEVKADCIILNTSLPDGLTYIETANLDGETNAKTRRAKIQTVEALGTVEDIVERSLGVPASDAAAVAARMNGETSQRGGAGGLETTTTTTVVAPPPAKATTNCCSSAKEADHALAAAAAAPAKSPSADVTAAAMVDDTPDTESPPRTLAADHGGGTGGRGKRSSGSGKTAAKHSGTAEESKHLLSAAPSSASDAAAASPVSGPVRQQPVAAAHEGAQRDGEDAHAFPAAHLEREEREAADGSHTTSQLDGHDQQQQQQLLGTNTGASSSTYPRTMTAVPLMRSRGDLAHPSPSSLSAEASAARLAASVSANDLTLERVFHERHLTLDERLMEEGALPLSRHVRELSAQYDRAVHSRTNSAGGHHHHHLHHALHHHQHSSAAAGRDGDGAAVELAELAASVTPSVREATVKSAGGAGEGEGGVAAAAAAASAGSHGVVLVSCAPTPDLSVWYGQLRLPTGEMVPLGIDQFIPRGCLIRNTDWVLGAVVYTGSHTKMLLNLRPKPNKITNMTRRLNQLNVFLFALNQVLMFLMCGMAIWSKHYLLRPVPGTVSDYSTWYLQWTLNRYSDVTLFWWRYLTNFILLSYLIPMSLYVTLEFNKAMQMLMIGADKRMAVYDEFTGTIKNARPKTSELNCQLGYVRYIFTDKTGTLTENLMTYVGGVVDGHTHSETEQPGGIGRALLRRRGGGGNNSNTNYRDSNTFHNTASWNGGTAARRIASLGSGVFNDDFFHLTASGVGGFHNAMDSSFAGPVNDGAAGNENGGGHGQPRPPPPPPLSVLIPALARNRSTMPADGGEAPTTNNGIGGEGGSGNAGSLRYPAPLTAPPSAGAAGQTGLVYQMPTALATPTAPYPSSTPFPPPPLQGISRSSLTATTGAAANPHRRVTSAEGAAVRFAEPPAPASPAPAAAGSSAGAVEALITPPRPGHARLSSAVGLPPASPKSYHHGVLSGGGGAFQLGNSGTFGNFGSVSAGAFLSASNCYDGGGGGRHYSSSGLRYVSEAVLERDPLFRYLRALALCHSIVCFPVTGPDSVAADDNDNSANHKNNNSSSSNGHPQHTGGGSKDAGDGNRTAAAGDDAKAERRRLRKEKRERRRDEKKQKKKEKKAAMGKKKEHRRPADATAGALATHEGEAPMQPASRNPSAHHSRPHRSTTEPADTSAAGVQRDGAPAHARHGSNVHVPPVSRTLSLSNIPPSNFVEIPYAVPAGPDRDAHEPYSQSPGQPAPLPHYHHRRGPSNGVVGSHEPVTSATVSGDYPPPYSGYQMTTSPSLTPSAQNAVTPSASVRMVPSAAHHPEPHSSARPPPLSLHHHNTNNSPSGVSKLHGRTSSASWYQNRYFNRVMHSRNLSQNSNLNSVRFGGAAAAAAAAGSPLLSATANSRVFRNGTSTVGSVAAADGLAGTLAGGGLEAFIDRRKIYEGQSLDEIALVNAARENGFSLFERTAKQMYVKALGRVMCYDIIAELEFTPQRKLMSILLQRRPDLDTELAATSAAAGTSSHYHRKSAETRAAELQQQQQQDEMMSLCQSMNAASVASRGFTDHEVALSYLNEHHQPFTPDAFPLTSQQQQLLPQDSDGSAAALRRVSALGSGGAGAAAQRHAESKKYLLLVKGADSSMMEIVNMQKKSNTRVKEKMLSELDAMAQLGLRTLVLGQRHVDEAEVLAWLPVYNEAQCSMQDRNERLHEAYAMLEKNVDIVGTTAVEDKLQDEVPQTLEFCIQASIVVWMLTGDKRETAVTIAHTSGLVSADYTEYVCHLDVSDLVEEEALLKQQRQYEERAREKQQEKKDKKNKKDRKKRVDGDGEGENDGGDSSSSGGDDDDDSEESDSVSVSPSPTAGQPSPPSGSKSIDVSSATQPQHGLSSGSHSPGPQSASTVPGEGGSLLRAAGHSSMPDKAATAESFMERKLARIEAQLAAAEQKCAEGEEAFGTHTVVVVVDGKTLDFIFQDNARAHRFFLLGSRCRSAVCCRMTPLQKAKIVRMFKRNMNAVALAIGDGANDVSMIQESSIGVGIMGLEGSQAELASDYAIPKFRFLKRLLFVHGRFSVFREAHCIVYSLYKNVIVTVGMMAYQFYTCYSGQALMDSWLLAMFSIFFCSLQPLMIGILDKDVEDELAESLPKLYPPLAREYMYFSYPYIMKWLLDGLLEGIFFFFVLMYTVGMQDNLYPHMTAAIEDYGTTFFTMLVLVADFRVGTLVTYYMILFALAVGIEILLVPIIELVYSAMNNLAGSNWCVRIANELYGTSGKFWLMLFFACGVLVMVTMASNMYIQLFAPWQNAGFAMRAAKASNHRVPYRHMKKELKAEYARLLARYEELRQQLEEEEERDREREGSGGGSFGGTARDHR